MKRNVYVGAAFIALIAVLAVASFVLDRKSTVQAAGTTIPHFEVDPMWPKPLPNHWIMGNVIGLGVDSKDHIWLIHRQGSVEAKEVYADANPPQSECCHIAPPVLCFDEAGNLLQSWGGKDGDGFVWPASNHGITVDGKGNVWIGGNGARGGATTTDEGAGNLAAGRGAAGRGAAGRGAAAATPPAPRAPGAPPLYHDSMVMKFTQDGKFLGQFGKSGESKGSNDKENVGLAAKIFIDNKANEAYIADGYGNKRVLVLDVDTMKYKRHWGAYGHVPEDARLRYDPNGPPSQQFANPVHCAELANDGMLYVCDRVNDRIQVFKADGTFVKEHFYYKQTLGDGAVWDIAFSKDPKQQFIYLADGANEKVRILDRDSLEELANFGDGGRQPGEFYAVHSIATDSKGNVFTTETYRGQRIQKFVFKGTGPVTKKEQGVLWPKSAKSPTQ